MSTTFYITPGYESGYLGSQDSWDVLKMCVKDILDYPQEFNNEAMRFIRNQQTDIKEYIDIYMADTGCPLTIVEDNHVINIGKDIRGEPIPIIGTETENHVAITASGGGESRTIKEHVANAFCRMIMEKVHSHGCLVSIDAV